MRLMWLPGGWEDYLYWQQTDRKMFARVNDLIRDCMRIRLVEWGNRNRSKGIYGAGGRGESISNIDWFIALSRRCS
jgi:hypothetical protein